VADTWATSFTFSFCIKKMGSFVIVICGLKMMDGDTG
jgi:hypothetical protein